jgi:hypothetical protein
MPQFGMVPAEVGNMGVAVVVYRVGYAGVAAGALYAPPGGPTQTTSFSRISTGLT